MLRGRAQFWAFGSGIWTKFDPLTNIYNAYIVVKFFLRLLVRCHKTHSLNMACKLMGRNTFDGGISFPNLLITE